MPSDKRPLATRILNEQFSVLLMQLIILLNKQKLKMLKHFSAKSR